MATGATAPLLTVQSSPPPLPAQSLSNVSSPLSEVEDKDDDGDDFESDMRARGSRAVDFPKHDIGNPGNEVVSSSDLDDDSKLSDADINDSEAETERLYETPPKNNGTRDIVVNGTTVPAGPHPVARRDRTFEPSPSKLQKQIKADVVVHKLVSDNELLSDDHHGHSDDVLSPPSEPDGRLENGRLPRSRSLTTTPHGVSETRKTNGTQDRRLASSDSRRRKRKRSTDQQPEAEQPRRKRTGPVVVPEADLSVTQAATVIDNEGATVHVPSGEHSVEEADDQLESHPDCKDKEIPATSIEEILSEPRRAISRRNGAKDRKKTTSPDDGEGVGDGACGGATNGAETTTVERATRGAEDEPEAEADADAEAIHREEEMERKKQAWEELTAIEKQFSSFRERLYQERLAQLDREEAMLSGPNPTHPEYVAMLQCVDARRDERKRLSTVALALNMDVLQKRAVAERAQIMSQYFQAVRASREKIIEALGQDWYTIQHERRRHANTIPDYGIRLPTTKAQNVKNAVAYNKEVSILSGFAKYVGFPAAPNLYGASEEQLDHDFQAIQRVRHPAPIDPAPQPPQAPFHRELSASLPFGRIGPAGEQFIEQTPWANPNHPSHHIQRQLHAEANASAAPVADSTPGPRRHSHHQSGALFTSSTNVLLNGASSKPMQKSFSSAGHDTMRPSKMARESMVEREMITQAS